MNKFITLATAGLLLLSLQAARAQQEVKPPAIPPMLEEQRPLAHPGTLEKAAPKPTKEHKAKPKAKARTKARTKSRTKARTGKKAYKRSHKKGTKKGVVKKESHTKARVARKKGRIHHKKKRSEARPKHQGS